MGDLVIDGSQSDDNPDSLRWSLEDNKGKKKDHTAKGEATNMNRR